MNESDFLAQIDATPSDYPFILSVFADWLEEKGDSRFIGVRWLSQKKIQILSSSMEQDEENYEYYLWIGSMRITTKQKEKCYRWWSEISHISANYTGVELFRNLPEINGFQYPDCAEYPSISSAFLDLANSYIKTIQGNPNFR